MSDKRLAHTDKLPKSALHPFNIPMLTDEQLAITKNLCAIMWSIHNKAAEPFNVEFSTHVDDTTENVITLYGTYYKFCLKSGNMFSILL